MLRKPYLFTLPELQRLVDNGEAWRGEEWLSKYAASLIAVGKLKEPS